MIKVAAFSGGRAVPGARFRVRQYIGALATQQILLDELPCRVGKYPPANKSLRPLWLAAALCEQAINLRSAREYDVVMLQREIISKLVTFERWTGARTLLDVDDAIFLYRGGYVARRLAERSACIICGNDYLAEWFSRWHAKVRVIPTAVDTERYRPAERVRTDDRLVIGWLGTSSNLHELEAIEGALKEVLSLFPEVRVRVVSDRPPAGLRLRRERIEFAPWREETEVQEIQGMDIGIMPLQDSSWARGKCSYKMLQYMACGIPAVVSAVGMNVEVARTGGCAHTAKTTDEWIEGLCELVRSGARRRAMGAAGRTTVENAFSVKVLAPQLAEVIRNVAAH